MEAIEFTAKIVDGVIKIPFKVLNYQGARVKVILLFEPMNLLNQKEKLEHIFLKMQKLNLFSTIDNPMKWQQNQRNEWE